MTKTLFDVFKGKKILITGDTGFKGSWLAIWLLELGADVYGYSLPAKSNKDNYKITDLEKRITHKDGDIRDFKSLNDFFKTVSPDIAIHMAAQSLVIDSYHDPVATFDTNVMGTVNFFEAVRNCDSIKAAINVTSDKCYENEEWLWGYRENDKMGGKDPYSASKGCSELVTNSFIQSFFQSNDTANVASVRAGNVIGGGDWSENRIIPDFFRSLQNKTTLLLRNPTATRPWQFVLEPLNGYLTLAAHLFAAYGIHKELQGGWNFGPEDGNNVSVSKLIDEIIVSGVGGGYEIEKQQRVFKEASLLKLDISKAKKLLNWKPYLSLHETISFTAKGYTDETTSGTDIFDARVQQIRKYINITTNPIKI